MTTDEKEDSLTASSGHASPRQPPPGREAVWLLRKLRASEQANRWVPEFVQDWGRALDEARHSYDLTPMYRSYRSGRSVWMPRPPRRSPPPPAERPKLPGPGD
ncbi:DUF6247 family protein [Kitasatospora sp. NPDC101801]|uniref:DUF6247 family protein n=1 Tax=Kitasatospora sp. NPDC101801 TaxID=3364103 RepID=UPI00382CC6F9